MNLTINPTWQAAHPKIAGLIVVVESALVGSIVDVITNGMDFSKNGLKHLATIVGTTILVAVRNYLKTSASDLKVILATPTPPETK